MKTNFKQYQLFCIGWLIIILLAIIGISITRSTHAKYVSLENITVPFNPKFEDYNLSQMVTDYYMTSMEALQAIHNNNIKKTINHNNNRFKSDDVVENVLIQAVALTGIPYRWGGSSPKAGFDCSGFIRYVFRNAMGITLPRTAAQMAHVGKPVPLNQLEPGDLLLFDTDRGENTHVGMYVGQNRFIQAPQSGERIKISVLDSHYREMLGRARRIIHQEKKESDIN